MIKLLLTLIIALTCLAQAAAYTFEVDGIYYNKNGTNATVTFRDNNYNSYSKACREEQYSKKDH